MSTKEIKNYSKKYFGTYQKIYDLHSTVVQVVPNPFEPVFSIADFRKVAVLRDAKHRLDSATNLIIEIFATSQTHYGEAACYKMEHTWNVLQSYLVAGIDIARVVYPDDIRMRCGNSNLELRLGGILVDGITLSFDYKKGTKN